MAIMIPSRLKEEDYDPSSREDLIYNSLKQNLPDTFYVFHSVSCNFLNKYKKYSKAEIDFLILNTDKTNPGIIIVEAKYIDGINIEDGVWYDKNGNKIHYGYGPYRQVETNLNIIKQYFDFKLPGRRGGLPLTNIVWFHKMSQEKRNEIINVNDFNLNHTFFREDLVNPTKKINDLLKNTSIHDSNPTKLSDYEIKMLKTFLNVENYVFDSSSHNNALEEDFNSLLEEQVRILDFLENQNIACIQGLGGTGKTVVAITKALKCAFDGDTLFLCYNSALRDFLKEKYKNTEPKFDIKTLDELRVLAGNKFNIENPGYSILNDYILNGYFKYKHVIIDEAQDFGRDQGENIDNFRIINDFFELLKNNSEEKDGNLFIFFDKYQCIQSNIDLLPDLIKSPECLLTLHTNCRNTKEISYTSLKPLEECYKLKINHKVNKNVSNGKPYLYLINNNFEEKLEKAIVKALDRCDKSITILTLKSIEKSIINKCNKFNFDNKGSYYYINYKNKFFKIPVTTVRKFKGLESDSIILIDVNEKTFAKEVKGNKNIDIMLFYVGASRAKFNLFVIADINKDNLKYILKNDYNQVDSKKSVYLLEKILDVINIS